RQAAVPVLLFERGDVFDDRRGHLRFPWRYTTLAHTAKSAPSPSATSPASRVSSLGRDSKNTPAGGAALRRRPLMPVEDAVQGPEADDVRPGTAQMAEDVGLVAAGVLQGVAEDGEAADIERAGRHRSLLVGGLSECDDGRRSPSGVEGDGPEGTAQYAT